MARSQERICDFGGIWSGRSTLRKGGEGLFLLLAGDTAVLYGLRELALLLSVQQRDEADLVEILAN